MAKGWVLVTAPLVLALFPLHPLRAPKPHYPLPERFLGEPVPSYNCLIGTWTLLWQRK